MIMVDHEIRDAIKSGAIKISPFDPALINPNSLDVRLGGNYSALESSDADGYIDPQDKSTFKFTEGLWIREGGEYLLGAREFILASLLEDITLPDNICAEIRGKSSIGRLGIANSSVAGIIDTGWSGVLTIELYNYSDFAVLLKKGMKIGQILFHKTEICDKPYSQTGRYYKQDPGQGSKGI